MADTGKTVALIEALAGGPIADLKSAISGMTTATASDVGKALAPKTVVDGVVTEWQFIEGGGGDLPSANGVSF